MVSSFRTTCKKYLIHSEVQVKLGAKIALLRMGHAADAVKIQQLPVAIGVKDKGYKRLLKVIWGLNRLGWCRGPLLRTAHAADTAKTGKQWSRAIGVGQFEYKKSRRRLRKILGRFKLALESAEGNFCCWENLGHLDVPSHGSVCR